MMMTAVVKLQYGKREELEFYCWPAERKEQSDQSPTEKHGQMMSEAAVHQVLRSVTGKHNRHNFR